jgi:hypothetical protein
VLETVAEAPPAKDVAAGQTADLETIAGTIRV